MSGEYHAQENYPLNEKPMSWLENNYFESTVE